MKTKLSILTALLLAPLPVLAAGRGKGLSIWNDEFSGSAADDYRIEEGIRACVNYTRDQNPWDSQERTPELMKVLLSYGTHAKPVIRELTRIADYFEKEEKDFPPELMIMKAKCVRKTIRAIEASKETPQLIRIR